MGIVTKDTVLSLAMCASRSSRFAGLAGSWLPAVVPPIGDPSCAPFSFVSHCWVLGFASLILIPQRSLSSLGCLALSFFPCATFPPDLGSGDALEIDWNNKKKTAGDWQNVFLGLRCPPASAVLL